MDSNYRPLCIESDALGTEDIQPTRPGDGGLGYRWYRQARCREARTMSKSGIYYVIATASIWRPLAGARGYGSQDWIKVSRKFSPSIDGSNANFREIPQLDWFKSAMPLLRTKYSEYLVAGLVISIGSSIPSVVCQCRARDLYRMI